MNIQTAETKVRPRSSFYFLLQRVLIRWFSGFCTRVMFNHIQLHICGKILPTIRKSHLPHSGSFLLTVLNINGTFTAFDYHCCNLILRCWYTLMSVRQRERKRYRERDSGNGGKGMDTLLWLFFTTPILRNPAPRMNAMSFCSQRDSWGDIRRIYSSSKATVHPSAPEVYMQSTLKAF